MYTVQQFCVYNINGGKGRLMYTEDLCHASLLIIIFFTWLYTYFHLLILFSCKDSDAKNNEAHEIQHFNHASTNVLLPKNFVFSWRKPNLIPFSTKGPLYILLSKVFFRTKPELIVMGLVLKSLNFCSATKYSKVQHEMCLT